MYLAPKMLSNFFLSLFYLSLASFPKATEVPTSTGNLFFSLQLPSLCRVSAPEKVQHSRGKSVLAETALLHSLGHTKGGRLKLSRFAKKKPVTEKWEEIRNCVMQEWFWGLGRKLAPRKVNGGTLLTPNLYPFLPWAHLVLSIPSLYPFLSLPFEHGVSL